MKTEERAKVKILKAALGNSKLSYAKDALDYINILEKLLLNNENKQRELLLDFILKSDINNFLPEPDAFTEKDVDKYLKSIK